jgi:hypothetical protein
MINPWLSVRVPIGWGLAVEGMDVKVAVRWVVGVSVGWVVDVDVGRTLDVAVSEGVSDAVEEVSRSGMSYHCMSRFNPYAHAPRIIRLINTRSKTPAGVMRIVHPTRLLRVREGRDELEGSGWLVIIDIYFNFTRCKKDARVNPDLLLKPCPVKLVVYT